MSKLLVVGRVLMVWGVLMMLAGAGLWGAEWNASRHRLFAEATVTENVEAVDAVKGVSYAPRFRFRLDDGTIVQTMGREAAESPKFVVGESVRLAYPVGRPQDAVVATVWAIYSAAMLCGIAGVVLFDGGAIVWWMGRRRMLLGTPAGKHDKNRKMFASLFGQNGGYRS